VQESRGAGPDDLLRGLADVALEAAAAHAAERSTVILDEELRAGPPISRAGDVDDRRERGGPSERGEVKDAYDDLCRFTPMFHSRLGGLRICISPEWRGVNGACNTLAGDPSGHRLDV
jgi:hypothetical protein